MSIVNRKGEFFKTKSNKNIFSQEFFLNFLYKTLLGRFILKIITIPVFSKIIGAYMDSEASLPLAEKFIKKHNIDMSEYESEGIRTYNDFFTRKIKPNARKTELNPNFLISPCDSKLSVFKINKDSIFEIKNSFYSVKDMLENERLAENFQNGLCLIFRLEVTDYHRYCYFDSGVKSKNFHIKGILHTINPIAFEKYNVYKRNSREYSMLRTDNFGDAVQIEVGALLVGKIKNHHQKVRFKKGQEKGMFLFGGSTIVILLQENKAVIDSDIIQNSLNGHETIVKYGEKIGYKANI